MIRDDKAEALEAQGLWRRAAARWLDVMNEAHTDPQRERIARRREICLENAKRPPKKRETFCKLQDAVNKTVDDMGIRLDRRRYGLW
ncbi:PerC family transcriptional regulator, partial [Escherichia coli]|nr:PerC family transcriptional regulator [Escherichia coli]